MEPIKDTKLEDLMVEANVQILHEARDGAIVQIKKLIASYGAIANEVKKDEIALSKKKDSLKKREDLIARLQTGDWTALKAEDNQNQ